MIKKIFMLVAMAGMTLTGAYTQVSFGIRAGINFQNINGKDDVGDKLENDLTVGFHAGADVEIPVAPDFYFQPGLSFSAKGADNIYETEGPKASFYYLELPLHLVYKPQLGSGRLIVGFGPYVAYGLTGKIKPDSGPDLDIKFRSGDLTDDELAEIDADEAFFFKPIDAGADIFFGYEFAFKVTVQLNAQLGLLNMWPSYDGDEDDESVLKNTGFGVSLGYRF